MGEWSSPNFYQSQLKCVTCCKFKENSRWLKPIQDGNDQAKFTIVEYIMNIGSSHKPWEMAWLAKTKWGATLLKKYNIIWQAHGIIGLH